MRTFLLLFVMALSAFGQAYHADNRTTTIHTPFRWVVADSAARVGLTVTARDTQKLCFQLADTSIWCLIDNSPLKWAFISGKKVDSLYLRTFQAVTAGITAANIDTSHSRHATADSATIPVLKGTKTFRDSSYFAGGLRGSRLYMQTASVDSFTKSFVVRGNVFGFSQTAGSCPFTSYGTTNKINGYFGTLSNNDGGVICYDSSGTARINLPTRGSGYILGSIAINQTTPDSNLTVGGSAHVTGNARIDGGLRLGSGDLLSVYDTGSFACTTKVGEGFTVQKIGRIRYTIIGDVVTMEIDSQFIGTSNSNFWLLRTGMPIHLMPTKETYSPIGMVMDNGVYVAASACMYSSTDAVNDSLIMIIPTGGNGAFTSSGTKGFNGQYPNAKTCWTYKK